jgi:hypothetical protein
VVENLSSTNLESGTSIYRFQVKLAMILNFIVNGAHNYLVQYDEESAWQDANLFLPTPLRAKYSLS